MKGTIKQKGIGSGVGEQIEVLSRLEIEELIDDASLSINESDQACDSNYITLLKIDQNEEFEKNKNIFVIEDDVIYENYNFNNFSINSDNDDIKYELNEMYSDYEELN